MIRLVALLVALLAAPAALAQATPFDPDTVRAGRLDNGKMWLFEDPPVDYLAETYNFRPDAAWFERARLAALRMPGCSASFVSPHGLVATNHHCVQSHVVAVDRGGEGLLDAGFYARTLAEERRIPNMYVDQLVQIDDVTAEISAAADAARDDEARQAAIEAASAAVQARLLAARGIAPGDADADFVVQVVALYNGGRYSAYTFRRYRDVRLTMAPERALGYFGGDYDNFTYPRYALDFAFMRVYGPDGRPVASPEHFPLAEEPLAPEDLVFVVGNPGQTSRGLTVAQLEFLRDVQLAATLSFIEARAAGLSRYLATNPPNPDPIRSQLFSLRNQQKAFGGRLAGLRDPYIIARRRAAEQEFVRRSPEAAALVAEMAAVQAEKRALAPAYRVFGNLFNRGFGSVTLRRAEARLTGQTGTIEDRQPAIEEAFLAAELAALRRYYEEMGAAVPAVLEGEDAAQRLLATSALARAATVASAPADDPALALVEGILPDVQLWAAQARAIAAREADIARRLGRARFATFGTSVPPDATFSLRFSDGVVRGYPYNGTEAPPMTTLYGVYDRYHSFCEAGAPPVGDPPPCDWTLPESWIVAESTLNLATPVNFTSTADTIGGNSGSPVVNPQLRLVGLNFDRTIEGLVRDYLYAPERGRNVMVSTEIVLESLRTVYGMNGLADELTSGRAPR